MMMVEGGKAKVSGVFFSEYSIDNKRDSEISFDGHLFILGIDAERVIDYLEWKLSQSTLYFRETLYYDLEDIFSSIQIRDVELESYFCAMRFLHETEVLSAWGTFPREWFEELPYFIKLESYKETQNE